MSELEQQDPSFWKGFVHAMVLFEILLENGEDLETLTIVKGVVDKNKAEVDPDLWKSIKAEVSMSILSEILKRTSKLEDPPLIGES